MDFDIVLDRDSLGFVGRKTKEWVVVAVDRSFSNTSHPC